MSPRAGIRYSSRTRPVPWLTSLVIVARRGPTFWVTAPMNSSGMSMTRCSIGSSTWPSVSRVMICGLPTSISKPSRRIISIRMASWSSPRPDTRNVEDGDLPRLDRPVPVHDGHAVGLLHAAVHDPADDEPADVVVPVEHRHPELEPRLGIEARGGHRREDRLEQGRKGLRGLAERPGRGPRLGVRVEDGEVELILGGVEVDEQVVDLVEHLGGPRILAVDLVDDDDRRQARLERLLEHEAR